MNDETPSNNPFRLIIGTVLLGAGLVLVLDRLGVVDRRALPSLVDLWPLVLVVIGVRAWINTEGVARWFGAAFTIVGAALLADNLDLLTGDLAPVIHETLSVSNLVPAALVLGGLFFLLGGRLNRTGDPLGGGQRVGQLTMFGGADLRPRTDDFRGGWLAATFGGFELDLRDCKSTLPESKIDVVCMFGGGEIRVPDDWDVELTGLPLFGGFGTDSKRRSDAPASHLLKIHCVAMFGGLSVEY